MSEQAQDTMWHSVLRFRAVLGHMPFDGMLHMEPLVLTAS